VLEVVASTGELTKAPNIASSFLKCLIKTAGMVFYVVCAPCCVGSTMKSKQANSPARPGFAYLGAESRLMVCKSEESVQRTYKLVFS